MDRWLRIFGLLIVALFAVCRGQIVLAATSVNLTTNGVVYDSATGNLYATVPSGSSSVSDSLVPFNPYTGAVGVAVGIGTQSGTVAIASDGSYVYTVVNNGHNVQRYNVTSNSLDLNFSVGNDPISQFYAIPGQPNSVLLSQNAPGSSPPAIQTAIYKNGVRLPDFIGNGLGVGGPDIVAINETGTRMYGYQNTVSSFSNWMATVDSNGLTLVTAPLQNILTGYTIGRIALAGNLLFDEQGQIFSLTNPGQIGSFTTNGTFTLDPADSKFYSLNVSGSTQTILVYDFNSLQQLGSINVPGAIGTVRGITHFGVNGLALNTPTQVILLQSALAGRTPLTWNTSAANASWNLASNWNAATTPHVVGDTAIFGPLFPTAPETVTLDSNPTISFLTFNNASGVTITPGNPAGSLTFDAGPGATAAITVAAGSHMIGAPMVLNNPLSISLSPATSLSLSGVVSNGTSGNGLSISGGGTVSLSAANTFSGGASVSAGTLLVANPNGSATGTGSVVVQAGGSLGGSGTIAGAVSTVSTGTGPANNGHLAPGFAGTPSTLNLAGGLTLANNSFLDYRLNSNTASGNDLTAVTGDLALGIGGTLDIAAYQNSLAIGTYKLISYSGSLSGSTNGWTIGANNDPAGHTYWLRTSVPHEFDVVVGGTAVTWTGRIGGTGAVDDSWNAASTNWANSSNQPIAFPSNVPGSFADTNATGGPAPDGMVNVQATGVAPIAVIFNNNNVNYQLNTTANSVNPSQSGVYGMTNLIKNGVGSLTLVGPNSYRGGTVINAGVISLTDDSSLGTVPTAPTSANITLNGGTLQATASFDLNSNRGVSIGPLSGTGTGTIDVSGAGTTLTYAGLVSDNGGTGTLLKVGAGTLLLSGASTYTGGSVLARGTLILNGPTTGSIISGPAGTGVITLGDVAGSNSASLLVGTLNSPGGLTVANPIVVRDTTGGLLTIGGQNSGGVDFYGGNITLGFSANMGKSITLAETTGGELDLTGNILRNGTDTAAALSVINSSGMGAATILLGGMNTYAGGTTIASGVTLVSSMPSSLGAGPVTLGGGNLRVGALSSALYGNSIVLNAGTGSGIDVGATAAAPTITMGALTINGGAASTLNITSATAPINQAFGLTLGNVALNGNAIFNIANNGAGLGTLTLGTINDSGASQSVTKAGAGILILAGSTGSVYGGGTFINSGTLQIANSTGSATGSGAVTVASGGTLAATSISGPALISGAVTVAGGGTIASGTSLKLRGGLALQAGSSSSFALGIPNGTNNALIDSSTGSDTSFVVNGAHAINLSGAPQYGTYDLIGYSGSALTSAIFSNFSINSGFPSGYSYQLVNNTAGTQLDLQVTSTAPQLTWTGASGGGGNGIWDIGSTPNWADSTPAAATYTDGSAVIFGDTSTLNGHPAITNNNITIAAPSVTPQSLTFNNNTANYTIGGNPIAGSAYVVKNGSALVTLAGGNSFSGGVTINGGTLVVSGPTSAGTGPIILNGGNLRPSVAVLYSLSGFGGSGTGWTVNSSGISSAPFPTTNVLQLTDNNASESRSAFFNTPVPIATGTQGFAVSFTYQDVNNGAADGIAFVLQRDPRGVTAIGGAGGSFGYGASNPITPSVALEMNLYFAPNTISRVGWATNGQISTPNLASPVVFSSGHPIQVSLRYDANSHVLTEAFKDVVANTVYTRIDSGIDVAGTLGSSTAYVGFTGGVGSFTSTQQISNFAYNILSNTYSNAIILNPGSASGIDVAATATAPAITLGALTVANGTPSTLNVTASTAPANQGYGLTLGNVSLNGSVTLNVTNNGTGVGTLSLGALNDGGSAHSLTLGGGSTGTVILTTAATGLADGTQVNLNGGTLTLSASGALGTLASVSMSPGTALTLAAPQTLAALNGTGTVNLNGNLLTIGGADDFNSSFSGAISGVGGLIKTGGGTLTLTGATSTYTGPTTVTAGIVSFSTDAIAANTAAPLGLTPSSPTAGNVVINGGTLQETADHVTLFSTRGVALGPTTGSGGGTVDVTGSNTFTVAGTIANNGGSGSLTKVDTGTLVLTGVNIYGGGTNVANGFLAMGSSSTGSVVNGPVGTGSINLGDVAGPNSAGLLLGLPNSAGGLIVANPVNIRDTTSGTLTVGGQNTSGVNTYSGNLTLGSTSNTGKDVTVVAAAGGEVDFTGNILRNGAATAGAVTVAGPGIIRFAGANTYVGGTVIGGGTLVVNNAQNLSTGPITLAGGTLRAGQFLTPVVTPGLQEGRITGNAFDITSPNPANSVIRLSPRMGEDSAVDGVNYVTPPLNANWDNNETWVYTGQILVPASGKIAFAENIDDSAYVAIDGVHYMNNSNRTQPTSTGVINLSPGWHNIDIRFGNVTGGAGPSLDGAIGWTAVYGFGYKANADGTEAANGANYAIPIDDGSGSFFRFVSNINQSIVTLSNNVSISADSTIDLGVTVTSLTMGTLSIGSQTLNVVAGAGNPTNTNFNLAFGATTLSGNAAFNVANNGTGTGTLFLASVNDDGVARTISKSGSGTLEIDGAPTFSNTTSLQINGGRLRFNVASGAASIGTGVAATVAAGATLELAGSVSALSSGANRVNITNNSSSTGLLVSGTHQRLGNIDGSGTTQVNAGSDLTANHIIQTALVIGGASGNPGLVTIDASVSNGNPLVQSSEFTLAGSLSPSDPFGAGDTSFTQLSSIAARDTDLIPLSAGNSTVQGHTSPVPEPSALLLALLAVLSIVSTQFARHRLRCQTV